MLRRLILFLILFKDIIESFVMLIGDGVIGVDLYLVKRVVLVVFIGYYNLR